VRTALFAWELGANLGHAMPMAAIARGLPRDRVRFVVAGGDLVQTATAFAGVDATLLQSPLWPRHSHFGNIESQANYLDVLVHTGFAVPEKLAAVVRGWQSILDLVQPDVIIADYSPALIVAALGGRVPVVQIGSGFTTPPLDYDGFPPLRAERAPIVPEPLVLATASEVLGRRGIAAPARLPELFRTDGRVVFSFPELDPYRAFRREPVYLPPESLATYSPPPIEPALFVYLGDEIEGLDEIIQALVEIELPAHVYLRGDLNQAREFLRLRGKIVYDAPPNLAEILPRVSHVVFGGGIFTAHAAVAAGRPQLVLPTHHETLTNYYMLNGLGVARSASPPPQAVKFKAAIRDFVEDHQLITNARHWSEVISLRGQPSGAEAARSLILRHL
jgi:UDP:flavonoid glycosyltransferase YjiC (YdhE family)